MSSRVGVVPTRRLIALSAVALGGCGLVLDASPPTRDPDAGLVGIDAPSTIDAHTELPDVAFPDVFIPDAPGADVPLPDVFVPDVFVPPEDDAAVIDCTDCVPIDACETTRCESGTCIREARAAGTECRPSSDACDLAEHCDGNSLACPDDRAAPVDKVCRHSSGPCDPPELCDGSDTACPDDRVGFDWSGACGAGNLCVGNTCVIPSACTAGAPCRLGCVEGRTICRGEDVVCDAAAGAPVVPAGTVCRPSLGACDPAEVCDGTTRVCPIDARAVGRVCRDATGACDAAELCERSNTTCPADRLFTSGASCTGDACRACSGTSADCTGPVLVDTFCMTGQCAIDGTCVDRVPICHDDDNPCRTGTFTTGTCGGDDVLPPDTLCRVGDGQCFGDAFCTAAGVCPDNAVLFGHDCTGWCPGVGRVRGTCTGDGSCAAPCAIP